MRGISDKFYVLYMFSGFLFYSDNLSRRQKKQAGIQGTSGDLKTIRNFLNKIHRSGT